MDGGVDGRIVKARINRTKFFYSHREEFNKILFHEIDLAYKRAKRKGHKFAARLNGTSDINPTLFRLDGKTVFEKFPKIKFYDYTKVFNRLEYLASQYKNYDMTFSFSGHNEAECHMALAKGFRVAVIFNITKSTPFPKTFGGYRVVDGDKNDYRIGDKKGVIVGLRWKRIADSKANAEIKKSKWVIQPGQTDF